MACVNDVIFSCYVLQFLVLQGIRSSGLPANVESLTGDANIATNQNGNYKCVARGDPLPSVDWLFKGKSIRDAFHKFEFSLEVYGSHVISRLGVSKSTVDEGDLKCIVSNELGAQTSKIKIKISDATAALDELDADDVFHYSQRSFMDIKRKREVMERKETLCAEVASFTPHMCTYKSARKFCKGVCGQTAVNRGNLLKCGQRSRKEDINTSERVKRIIGGKVSAQGEWPWHVSMRIGKKMWCAGSILSEHFILTAWHCFNHITSTNAKDWMVVAGDYDITKTEKFEQAVQVKRIFRHPKGGFTEYKTSGKHYAVIHDDVAILQLMQPIKLDDANKGAICLPLDSPLYYDNSDCYIAGWGHTSFMGHQSKVLYDAKVRVVPTNQCNAESAFNGTVNGRKTVCAGYKQGGVDACNFDSGGALACQKKGSWHLTGIISSGYKCAQPDAYGMYTRVSTYKKWIIDTILNKA